MCFRLGLIMYIVMTGEHPGGSTAALQMDWIESVSASMLLINTFALCGHQRPRASAHYCSTSGLACC